MTLNSQALSVACTTVVLDRELRKEQLPQYFTVP